MSQIARSGREWLMRRLGRAGSLIARPRPSGFTVGDFWANTYQALNPSTSTAKFNDVGVGDQTTFEQVTGGVGALIGITVVRNFASTAGYTSLTAKLFVTDTITYTFERWNGTTWVNDILSGGIDPVPGAGGNWITLTKTLNPASTTNRVRLSVQTQGSGIASDVRIGDFRVS